MLVIGLFAAACGGDDPGSPGPGPTINRPAPGGEQRSVLLGFSSLPMDLSPQAFVNAFATAATYADAVLIQRAPPWEDFMPGGTVSRATNETARFETSLLDQYSGLKRFYAIDPTDGAVQRTRIAGLPSSVDAAEGFADPGVRQAFVAYAVYVAKNYRPDYLALGVEVNMMAERVPRLYDSFVTLYREAYEAAKAASPKTKIFPTFQLEDLLGTYGIAHAPRWNLIDQFRGTMDALAVSSYPFLAGVRTVADLPADYYTQIRTHFAGEILVAETGYASAPVEGHAVVGTEEDQQAFLARILDDAEKTGFSLVVWFAALDPAFSAGAAPGFKDIGLRRADGGNKLAWTTWEEWARRPVRQGSR